MTTVLSPARPSLGSVMTSGWLLGGAAAFALGLARPSIGIPLLALSVLAAWALLCLRRPQAALLALIGFVLVNAHLFALAYRLGFPASALRVLLGGKDALAFVLVAVLLVRTGSGSQASAKRNAVLLAAPLALWAALSFVSTLSAGIPLGTRAVGLRGITIPLVAVSIGLLVREGSRRLADGILLLLVAGAVYALIEYFLPTSFLTQTLNVGGYWRDVKQQPGFLVGDLPGNFFTSSGLRRLTGAFGDPLTAGYVLAGGLVLARGNSRLHRLARPVLAVALVLTLTRVGWIIALLVFAATTGVRLWRLRARISVVLVGVLGIALVLGTPFLRTYVQQTLSLSDSSSIGHGQAIASNINRTYSLFGDGLGSAGGAVASGEGSTAAGTESTLVTVLIQLGWVGVLGLAWLLLGLSLALARERRATDSAGVDARRARWALLLGILVSMFLSEQALTFNAGFLVWLLVALPVQEDPVRPAS